MIVDSDVVREAGAILLVLALLGASVWVSRRAPTVRSGTGVAWFHAGFLRLVQPRSRTLPTKTLEIVERLTLTPQHSLHLVRNGADRLLVATHAQGCTLLAGSPILKQPVGPESQEKMAHDSLTLTNVHPVRVLHDGTAV